MNNTLKRVHSDSYEIYHGDKLVGTVGRIVASLNRPTGWWGYQSTSDEKIYSFRAGRTPSAAAIVFLKRVKLWKSKS